jgi:hypothetical protein
MLFNRKPVDDDFDEDLIVALDIETIQPSAEPDQGFMKWPHHVPALASLLTAERLPEGKYRFCVDTVLCQPGRESVFYEDVEARLPERGTVVTMNGKGFDLPVLALGAMRERVFAAPKLARSFRAKRYGRDHCDLAEMFTNYRAAVTPSLAEICNRLQIPVKTSTCGSDVAKLMAEGQIETVSNYCQEDCCATFLAYAFDSAFRHSDEARLVEPVAALARWIEGDPRLSHLLPFATCPPAVWAKERSILLSIEYAREAAERRVRRITDERSFAGNVINF